MRNLSAVICRHDRPQHSLWLSRARRPNLTRFHARTSREALDSAPNDCLSIQSGRFDRRHSFLAAVVESREALFLQTEARRDFVRYDIGPKPRELPVVCCFRRLLAFASHRLVPSRHGGPGKRRPLATLAWGQSEALAGALRFTQFTTYSTCRNWPHPFGPTSSGVTNCFCTERSYFAV
jgi:hypothetical protein